MSVSLSDTSVGALHKYKSFGWILRLVESRDSRVRTLTWDLLTEVFDFEFLKSHPSIA